MGKRLYAPHAQNRYFRLHHRISRLHSAITSLHRNRERFRRWVRVSLHHLEAGLRRASANYGSTYSISRKRTWHIQDVVEDSRRVNDAGDILWRAPQPQEVCSSRTRKIVLEEPLRFVVVRFQVVEQSLVLAQLRRCPQPRAHTFFECPLSTLRCFAPNVT